jgi:hypothetical protein
MPKTSGVRADVRRAEVLLPIARKRRIAFVFEKNNRSQVGFCSIRSPPKSFFAEVTHSTGSMVDHFQMVSNPQRRLSCWLRR